MNDEIALILTLVLYGNAFLRGHRVKIDEFHHSIFRYCKFVSFFQIVFNSEYQHLQRIIYAKNVDGVKKVDLT
jgi:hypothetical protein